MDKIRILYYLEDRAQEDFIKSLVKRIAREENIPENLLISVPRNTRGGQSIKAFKDDFREFIKDTTKAIENDIIVVSVDGNCKGYTERIKDLGKCIKDNHPFKDKVVYAIPNPHIERWYLMDQKAFKAGVGIDRAPDLPIYKCDKNYYKNILHKTLKEADISSLLVGVEYAERIVNSIEDIYSLGKQEKGFGNFLETLKMAFIRIKRERGLV